MHLYDLVAKLPDIIAVAGLPILILSATTTFLFIGDHRGRKIISQYTLGRHASVWASAANLIIYLFFSPLIISYNISKLVRKPINSRSFLLDLLLPSKIAKDAQANLTDALPIWVDAYGWPLAKVLYFKEAAGLIWGHWGTRVLSIGKAVLKIVQGS